MGRKKGDSSKQAEAAPFRFAASRSNERKYFSSGPNGRFATVNSGGLAAPSIHLQVIIEPAGVCNNCDLILIGTA